MSTFICTLCFSSFKTKTYLNKHKNSSLYCQTYKDVIFTCSKCNYTTIGIKNINIHMKKCESEKTLEHEFKVDKTEILNKRIIELEDELVIKNDLLTKIEILNNRITELENEIILNNKKFENTLKFELIKNKVYCSIIEQKLNIKLDNVIEEKDNNINIYNISDMNVSIVLHDYIKGILGD